MFIVFEIFRGESGVTASKNESIKNAFGALRLIVVVGWSIYPIGYFLGYLAGGTDNNTLNMVYNLADFINKIAFGLVIWAAAKSESAKA